MGRCQIIKKEKIGGVDVSFHKFPNDVETAEAWAKYMEKVNSKPTKHTVLCSEHFTPECLDKKFNRVYLKKGSVPTIYPDQFDVELPPTKKRRLEEEFRTLDNERYNLENEKSVAHSRVTSSDCDIDSQSAPQNMNSPDRSTLRPPDEPASTGQRTPSTTARQNALLHDHRYDDTPRTHKRKRVLAEKKLQEARESIKVLKRRVKRLNSKVTSLKGVVDKLKDLQLVSPTALDCLSSYNNTPLELFSRMVSNHKKGSLTREKYPPQLRCFALTLHFYSPKAYDYVRDTFQLALPHPDVLRTWYANIDAEPGFTEECFNTLQRKAETASQEGKQIICALIMDEMGVKKGFQRGRDGKQRGYVDVGFDNETGDDLPVAKDSLVLMVVALDSSWKIPVGYFLINHLNATEKAALVTEVLIRLQKVGVKICSLTMDGPPEHFSMVKKLGASMPMHPSDPPACFKHPVAAEPAVNVFLDPSHMLKNARNCIAEYKVLLDGNDCRIEWRFIENLAAHQLKEGLRLGNKLRSHHIDFKKNIMKVYLAAQTLSSSVADAIEFCCNVLRLPQFQGSEATVRFIRCIDRIFDFLNIRNPWGKGYKSPLRPTNEHLWRTQIIEEISYLAKLKQLDGMSMFQSRRRAGFIGLFTAVLSVLNIFDTYVKPPESQLKYLLTYKMSQDHLELFFCAVRGRSGWCPNPTAAQFVSAYKRLLIRHEVKICTGNAIAMDETKILNVTCTKKYARVDRYDINVFDEMDNLRVEKRYDLEDTGSANSLLREFLDFSWSVPSNLSEFSEQAVGYIAGFVVRGIGRKIRCIECLAACKTLLSIDSDVNLVNKSALIAAKTRGGLIAPSPSVARICIVAEKLFRRACNANSGKPPHEKNFPAVLAASAFKELLCGGSNLFSDLEEHVSDMLIAEEFVNHKYKLVKEILRAYIEIRLYALTKNYALQTTGTNLRHFINRTIVWAHQ